MPWLAVYRALTSLDSDVRATFFNATEANWPGLDRDGGRNVRQHVLKVLMLGSTGSGKSSALLRFVDDTWTGSFISTIGVDFRFARHVLSERAFPGGQPPHGTCRVRVQVWDVAGPERFRVITSSYYRGCSAVALCLDPWDEAAVYAPASANGGKPHYANGETYTDWADVLSLKPHAAIVDALWPSWQAVDRLHTPGTPEHARERQRVLRAAYKLHDTEFWLRELNRYVDPTVTRVYVFVTKCDRATGPDAHQWVRTVTAAECAAWARGHGAGVDVTSTGPNTGASIAAGAGAGASAAASTSAAAAAADKTTPQSVRVRAIVETSAKAGFGLIRGFRRIAYDWAASPAAARTVVDPTDPRTNAAAAKPAVIVGPGGKPERPSGMFSGGPFCAVM